MPSPILSGIDQRDAAGDDAVGLEPLQALPAGRGGQADPLADLGHRQRGILLHHGEDLAVDGVHALDLRRSVE